MSANINTIDAKMLQKMFLAGAKNLEAKKEWINELNVFPVPDGDTGTNMTLTILSAAKEVSAIEKPTMENLSRAIKSGSLRGARGNSGVILSQLFRGFTKEISQVNKIDTVILANTMQRATAYKAVMKPKEGTILTVAKGAADKASEIAETVTDLSEFIKQVIEYADEVLERTPDMLPVLKQAGVVDSGGQGLMQVLKGAYDAFLGKEIDLTFEGSKSAGVISFQTSEESDITFGYCTEFIIMLEKEYNHTTEADFKAYLESIGDSIVVVSDDDIVKVHVHTNDPGLAIQRALTYGSLTSMKIDNMREEHHEKLIKDAEKAAAGMSKPAVEDADRKPVGYICVAAGDGLSEIFKGLGADYIIEGGQTMNPSTEDMLEAIKHVNADTVYIFPNNSNIILAAQQATYLVEDKNIMVVPTKTIPQGITALINSMPENTPEDNLEIMTAEMGRVKTGQITYAVRNTTIDDVEIKENDIMGLGDHTILAVGSDITDTAFETIKKMADDTTELISIYYGSDVTEDDANALCERVSAEYPDCDIELQRGGQPIYYYILSAE